MTRRGRACSIADALGVIGEKWSLLAIREIALGFHRFDQIARNTGASRDILTARLRGLEAAGVIRRELYEAHPPRHHYRLTEAGSELIPVLNLMSEWGARHVTVGPSPTMLQHSCGADFHPAEVCAACGKASGTDTLTALRLGVVS